MKKTYGLLIALIISSVAMAQPTQHEKQVLKRDLVIERNKRHEVARDILHGQPAKARADHRAAVAYHKKIHRDVHQIHNNDVQRQKYHTRTRKHPYRQHRP